MHDATALNDATTLGNVLDFAHSIATSNESSIIERLPDVPVDNVKSIGRIIEANPSASPFELIQRLYPFDLFLPNESQQHVRKLIESLNVPIPDAGANHKLLSKFFNDKGFNQKISRVERVTESEMNAKPQNGAHYIGTFHSIALVSIFLRFHTISYFHLFKL